MIDIRAVAKAIDDIKLVDPASRQAAIHMHLRQYGTELLLNLRNAILPTTPEELQVVEWLRGEVEKIAKQIPEATVKKET